MTIVYILIAIIAFGLLIFIHELGHYLTAVRLGVSVKEFSIGMGPKIAGWTGKKNGTEYSLRLFPIGGFVSMLGEDEDSDDPHAFCSQKAWKRFIIVAAGAVMNILLGVVVMSILVMSSQSLGSTTIYGFSDKNEFSSADYGLMAGDRIVAVNGSPVHIVNELAYEIMHDGYKPLDITLIRNGEKITVEGVVFPSITSSGALFGSMDFYVMPEEKNFVNVLKHSFFRSTSTVKMIWESLVDLLLGRFGIEAVSGPVGVTTAIGDAAKKGVPNLVYLLVVISMNLGVFNLLPLPALDGGRLFFILIEMIFRKPVNPKYEAYIHFVGIVILLGFMALITLKDIIELF